MKALPDNTRPLNDIWWCIRHPILYVGRNIENRKNHGAGNEQRGISKNAAWILTVLIMCFSYLTENL